MNNTYNNIWYSGDWKQQNHDQVPYNGIKIEAITKYSPQTSPPTKQELISIDAIVTDYTKDPNGVSSKVTLSKTGAWYDIPIPEDNKVSPPKPNSNFTVTDIYFNGLGKLQLHVTTTGIYLRIQFRYGETNRTREELGFILKFKEYLEE
ncbi:hypothetical protein [uncultured Tenacibaculum sp.]|uniref:hypothetical protein n=1 Tax=uncultured Tenacibaculum sp. TaxID=174713 RepID=UPI00262C36BD|nr:hypothetical protein [uncultured Tenacibaculum sp.]